MKQNSLTSQQFAALLLVSMISPVFRQLPGAAVSAAGGASWVSALAAGGCFLLLGLSARGVLCLQREGEGLGEVLLRCLPPGVGRLVTGLIALYTALYAGFVLRAGADRFVSAVYPESGDGLFLAVMALLAVPGALGETRWVGRCAELAAPFLLLLLTAVFALALPGVDREALSLWDADAGGVAAGALPMLDTLCVAVYPLFLPRQKSAGRREACVCLILAALGVLLSVTTVGVFGSALTERIRYPFFVMIRGVQVARLLERVEPLIVGQWVITDFLLLSVLLQTAGHTAKLTLGGTQRKWTAVLLPVAVLCGIFCAGDAEALRALTAKWVPIANAAAVGVIALAGIVARMRNSEFGIRNSE